jgi:TonB family protein
MTDVRKRRTLMRCAGALLFTLAGPNELPAQKPKEDNDEKVYDIGPGITPPRVIHQVNPAYKPDSEGFRVSGTVLVGLVVSSKGEPEDVHVVHSLEKAVDQTAVDAVRQWQFEAARKADQPVAVRLTVEIRFHSM